MNSVNKKLLRHNAKKMVSVFNPNVKGWAKILVEAGIPISESVRHEFYKELSSEDTAYRKSLDRSINLFGVRWSK